MTTALLDSEIVYDRTTRDYSILIAGVICASAATYSQAEGIRTHLLAERAGEGHYATATELDDDPPPAPPVDDGPADNFGGWYAPNADWGAYATGEIGVCACGTPATILLHGVHDTLDIALCYRCHGAYCSMEWPTAALAEPPAPPPYEPDSTDDNFGGWYAPGHCRNCGGPHATQRCPEIAAALRADPDDGPPPPWDAPDAGRAIGRQWLRDRARFLTVLSNLDRDAWTVLAAAYCAWMNRGGCGLDPAHVVLIWTKALERDVALPPKAA